MKFRWLSAAATLLVVAGLVGLPAMAQTTGKIEGTVTDTSGAPLPGASVTLSSVALQGTRTVVTNADGRYLFPALPPGLYTVTTSLSGFKKVERNGVKVNLDATATVPVRLEISVSQEIVVTGEAPVVDTTSASSGLSLRTDIAQKLPLGRNYSSVIQINPGVSQDNAETQGRSQAFTIYGSTSVENQYLVDGVNTTNVVKGFQGKALSQEFIEEVQVKTSGYEAEYGRAMGGVINVVTKSGGNEFHGDVFGYFDRKSLIAESDINAATDEYQVDTTQENREDYGADIGGYFMKDRIWFFGAYNRVSRDIDQIVLAGTGFATSGQNLPISYSTNIYSGKMTFRITDSTTVVGTVFGDPETRTGNVLNFTSSNEAARLATREIGALDFAVSATQLFGTFGLMTARYARHKDKFLTNVTADTIQYQQLVTNPAVPGFLRGGAGSIFGATINNESKRDQYQGAATFFFGTHEIKAGADYQKDLTNTLNYFTGDQRVRLRACPANIAATCPTEVIAGVARPVYYNHQFYTTSTSDPVGGFTRFNEANPGTNRFGWFVQDSWKVMPNLTVNLGVRWDYEKLKDATDSVVINLQNEWQPRIGIAYDVKGDGTSRLSASYGRFYYAVPTDINVRAYGFQLIANTFNFSPTALPQAANAPRAFQFQGGVTTEPVQAGIKGIYQDEATLGFDKALDPTFAVGARFTYRTLGRTIEDRCDFDYAYPEANDNTCVVLNPGSDSPFSTGQGVHTCDGRDYGEFAEVGDPNSGCSSRALFPGPAIPKAKRQYWGFEVVAKKQISNTLWAQASYIWSRLEGNYDGAARIGNGGAAGQTDPGINADYDYALFSQNAYGRMILDRPHSFRLDAAYTAPMGLTVGFQGYLRSGSPKNRLGYFNTQYGTEIYLDPRGSTGREKTDYEINLSLAYTFKFNPISVTLFAQGFNLLDRQTVLTSNYDYTVSPPGEDGGEGSHCSSSNPAPNCDFGLSSLRKAPRQLRLGARVSF